MNRILSTMQTLQRVALLGTDRAGSQLPTQPLPSAMERVPGESAGQESAARQPVPAAALALQWLAQTDAMYRAAGGHARTTEHAVVQAPDADLAGGGALGTLSAATRPVMPPAAQDALVQCIALAESGSAEDACALVVDLLQRAEAAGTCLPHAVLPEVLSFVCTNREACLNALPWQDLLGARGQWLVQQNPAWAALACHALGTAELGATQMTLDGWAIADLAQRLQALQQMRTHDPAQARAWIESTRASDPPAEVASYVAACQTGLGMDDHGWLEGLLDAKHKPVRTAAAACLAQLPGSALCLRALDYLTQPSSPTQASGGANANPPAPAVLGIIRKRRLFGLIEEAPVLHIVLPPTETYDKAMEKRLARDGYDTKAKSSTASDAAIGPKMGLVLQWLSVVPLDLLLQRLEVGYTDFFATVACHESKADMVDAMAKSLLAQAQSRWPVPVVEALLATECVPSERVIELLQRLPAAHKEAQLSMPHIHHSVHDLCQIFTASQGMGVDLSKRILDFLRNHKHGPYNRAWNSSDTIALALRLDTALAEAFVAEARTEQARNTSDMPANKACYAESFWPPLFQAIGLCSQYRRAFSPQPFVAKPL